MAEGLLSSPAGSKAEEFTTLVHECAHELLHKTESPHHDHRHRARPSRGRGLHRGHRLGDGNRQQRLHPDVWLQRNAALLTESLEVIQRTSAVIFLVLYQPKEPVEEINSQPTEAAA